MSNLSVGLTGGIGSGKTLICSIFSHLSIPVFYADDHAKECYNDVNFLNEIALEFGDSVIEGNKLNKAELAKIVFNDKQSLAKLNSMVHPKVLQRYQNWRKEQDAPYVIHENAIIFESSWEKYFDKIICIDTPLDVVISRLEQRDGMSKEDALARMNNQMSVKDKASKSDYVIYHDNQTMILQRVLEIHNQLLML